MSEKVDFVLTVYPTAVLLSEADFIFSYGSSVLDGNVDSIMLQLLFLPQFREQCFKMAVDMHKFEPHNIQQDHKI
jgi:hypothetical protein